MIRKVYWQRFLSILCFLAGIVSSGCKSQKISEPLETPNRIISEQKIDLSAEVPPHRVMATPDTVFYTQPDGNVLSIILKGDEHYKRVYTADGYSIVADSSGYYYGITDRDGNTRVSDRKAHDLLKRDKEELEFLKSYKKRNLDQ